MLRSILLSVLAVLLMTISSQAGNFEAGIIVGEPTGLCIKIWTGRTTAFDGAIAWSFLDEGAFHIHGDYLFHNFDLIDVSKGSLPFYYGLGGRIKTEDDTRLGARIPVGLEYRFANTPLDIFIEVVPILDIAPEMDFSFNAAIGIRFQF